MDCLMMMIYLYILTLQFSRISPNISQNNIVHDLLLVIYDMAMDGYIHTLAGRSHQPIDFVVAGEHQVEPRILGLGTQKQMQLVMLLVEKV